jgi:hypothetical protein
MEIALHRIRYVLHIMCNAYNVHCIICALYHLDIAAYEIAGIQPPL